MSIAQTILNWLNSARGPEHYTFLEGRWRRRHESIHVWFQLIRNLSKFLDGMRVCILGLFQCFRNSGHVNPILRS